MNHSQLQLQDRKKNRERESKTGYQPILKSIISHEWIFQLLRRKR